MCNECDLWYLWWIMIIKSVDMVWECEKKDWRAIDMEMIWQIWDEIIEKWECWE